MRRNDFSEIWNISPFQIFMRWNEGCRLFIFRKKNDLTKTTQQKLLTKQHDWKVCKLKQFLKKKQVFTGLERIVFQNDMAKLKLRREVFSRRDELSRENERVLAHTRANKVLILIGRVIWTENLNYCWFDSRSHKVEQFPFKYFRREYLVRPLGYKKISKLKMRGKIIFMRSFSFCLSQIETFLGRSKWQSLDFLKKRLNDWSKKKFDSINFNFKPFVLSTENDQEILE